VERYHGYPEDQSDYSDGVPAQPDYQENQAWYGEWNQREPDRHGETQRYEEPRHDPGRDPRLDHSRDLGRSSPGPAPAPTPNESVRVTAAAPRPAPPPVDDPRLARRPPVAPGSPGPMSDGVYRSKRPAAAALFGVPAAILEIPVLLLLQDAAFADPVSPAGVISAACLALALPLLAVGLYAVATGAVRAAGPNSAQAWLRPPVAYLSVALVLFIAAGLAA
jgi:hypothetical protein